MKALLINGSPHPKGCTYTALEELARTLEAEGIETEIVQAGGRVVCGCTGCGACRKLGKCVYDDAVNETAPKLLEADALVIGAPVHYASPAGDAISFMDRLFYSTGIRNLTIAGMPIASSQYWNMVYGSTPEEVRKDLEGLQTMRTLGRNMAFLMKAIQLGKTQYGLPEREKPIVTSFHHD